MKTGSFSERLVAWNARARHVPTSIVAVVLGFFIAGLVLAIAVPLMGRGTLRGWMVWGVILGCVLLVAAAQHLGRRIRR